MELPFDPVISLLRIYLKHSMFTAALFTITKIWKQPECPSMDVWIKRIWDICTMEYYSDIKKKTILSSERI